MESQDLPIFTDKVKVIKDGVRSSTNDEFELSG